MKQHDNTRTVFANGIFFEEYGDRAAPPLLLIHGSTMTGAQDFVSCSNMAERFAKRYRVIVPDCPGHGRSHNKQNWDDLGHLGAPLYYSFSGMAATLAQLLAVLDASPAYVIGHSNGGNIALYMAVEQPQHTRAVMLLAANAYIDDHLRQRVPVNMDPDHVAQHAPEWMHEMITLHDSHHGSGYWRDLLRATILETITNPDWTAAHLRHVQTPCLCVQGENDRVNAPGQHAQTLHDWLPNSQLWIPSSIGHSVHHELPDQFEEKVTNFFTHATYDS